MGFSPEQRIYCCIMAGCDYINSVRGIGIKKSINYLDKYSKIDSVIARFKVEKTFRGNVPDDYL